MSIDDHPIKDSGVLLVPSRPEEDGVDRRRLEEALESANLPTLGMVLYQLTGEQRWLEEPFTPTPTRGLSPHDLGGLTDEVAAELRASAADAICAWAQGAPVAAPNPDPQTLQRMMSIYVGEQVPEEYEQLVRHEMGLTEPGHRAAGPAGDGGTSVVVIGAGISGLLAAVRLREAGVPCTVLERNEDVGGVWLTNAYPGAGVDTPSFLYSYSFFPRRWSTHFGKRNEMAAYAAELADAYDLRRDIRFGTDVTKLVYDEKAQEWEVTARSAGDEQTLRAQAVISAVGTFNTPSEPDIPGLDSFGGTVVHSARWPDGIDLRGKRVAVVGAGASGQQIVPAIADEVAHLTVLQRSPQWIAPNAEYFAPVGEDVHWLMEHVPFYHAWYRARLAWIFNDRIHASLQIDPDWPAAERSLNAVNDGHRRFFIRYLTEQLEGREDLIAKSTPDYPPFGKRMLLDNGWYRTLRRDHVELVTDAIERVTATGIVAGGVEHEVDVIVLATGFVARRYLPFELVRGRGGRAIRDEWGDDDARAFLGMTIPGYPNLFVMYGPNTNAGAGGSVIFIAECQCDHIMQLIDRLAAGSAGAVEARPEALERWIEAVDAAHDRMVWSHPGMSTYYRNARGRVVTNSPWRIVDYWTMTRRVDERDYAFEPVRTPTASRRPDGNQGTLTLQVDSSQDETERKSWTP